MSDFTLDAAAVRKATDRLIAAVGELDDNNAAGASLLPGWTRGHVLAHLARNADALTNLLTWARTGVKTPMYASDTARDADIERDAARPLAAHLDDLRTSAERFEAAAAALPEERQAYEVAMRNGVTERAARRPFRRLVEVELHHVDLGVGYSMADLPARFVTQDLDFMTGVKLSGRGDVPALHLVADEGGSWRTGRAEGPPIAVTGSSAALLGWVTGRTDGSDLKVSGDGADVPLPALPPL